MNVAELSLVLFGVSVVAGVVGSLLGLGGGFVVVPVLTLAFHLDIRLAVGTSIVAVAATSSAGAARNVRERHEPAGGDLPGRGDDARRGHRGVAVACY